MKKNFFWMLMPLLAFVSCNNELEDSLNANQNQGAAGIEYPSYFSVMKVPKNGVTTRAGIPDPGTTVAKWDDFAIIKIYFMNGTPTLVNKVKSVASMYTELTNLTFKYVDDPAVSDVRIVFSNHNTDNNYAFNWSYLGKQCLQVSKSEPTMNLAIADINNIVEANDVNFRASILREFGHMLGMIYEYQRDNPTNPDEKVVLEVDNVYDGLGIPIGDYQGEYIVDKSYLNEHYYLVDLINTDSVDATIDETSIMLPYIPADWIRTTGRSKTSQVMFDKIAKRTNLELSAKDRDYIAAVYPKPEIDNPRGKEGEITISIGPTTANFGWTPPGYTAGWNYITNTSASRIINDYPTIQIGEYEWTTVNLRIKYQGNSMSYVNFDNVMINYLVGDAFGDDANTVTEFEKIFGNWATELTDGNYHYGVSYRNDKQFTRKDTNFPSLNTEFDLPDITAMLQLFGQMPHKTGDVYKDFRNFTFGLPDSVIEENSQLAAVLAQRMPFLNSDSYNTSGLSLVPLGSIHSHGEGDVWYRYQTHPNAVNNPYADWHGDAFMTTGTGVKLKMKINGAQQRNFNFHESDEEGREIILNQYLFHWGSVRYCRALTDEELGYKLCVDESSNIVVRLGLNEELEPGYRELPRGVERGVALSYLYIDEDNGIYYFTKSWSQIQQIAATINAYVRVH